MSRLTQFRTTATTALGWLVLGMATGSALLVLIAAVVAAVAAICIGVPAALLLWWSIRLVLDAAGVPASAPTYALFFPDRTVERHPTRPVEVVEAFPLPTRRDVTP